MFVKAKGVARGGGQVGIKVKPLLKTRYICNNLKKKKNKHENTEME
jgi:hypothetical protein